MLATLAILVALLATGSALLAGAARRPSLLPAAALLVQGALGGALAAALIGLALPAGRLDLLSLDLAGQAGAIALGLRLDAIALVMAALVAGVGLAVFAYARRHLRDDPARAGFLAALAWLAAVALVQVFSPGLVQFALAWLAAGPALERLLRHDATRPQARLAARAARWSGAIGDLALAGAVAVLLAGPGTTDFAALATLGGEHGAALAIAGALVVAAVVCRSALAPFQHWLIGTVEAPTPVSALMHAGVVNAAGYLVIRLSPALAQAGAALDILLAVGLLSALVGPLAMWAQTDLKRSLAWSTVGQMGFMAVQCGLGAFGSAFLHLVGHGLYKADAFLRSGTLANATERRPAAEPAGRLAARWLLGIGLAGTVLSATYLACGADPRLLHGGLALVAIQALAMGQLAASPSATAPGFGLRLALLTAASVIYAGATLLADLVLAQVLGQQPAALRSPLGQGLAATAVVAVATLSLLWLLLPGLAGRSALAWRIHAGHGFYLPHLTARLLGRA